ncbi:MAG: S-methyl-5-thioribose-1-phosphate isomerase [Deltaproteobacteria bacterium]|nr:S-methyl-5-thioribose-1-phosphate isomerase [Deltaproteobacteria bacterium]MBW2137883.1 S-methyl-5-thioribose-1-phosphate isomerase [Deltaproteobacteria bacterium]
MVPTIRWLDNKVEMIDQRKLPHRLEWYTCRGHGDIVRAIEKMVIRGAPAIGIAAAMGMALGARSIKDRSYRGFRAKFRKMADGMLRARPTAVNLRWAVERMTRTVEGMADRSVEEIRHRLEQEAESILAEDIEINKEIGRKGEKLIPRTATILTHCNAGALATGGYGTALGVIRAAKEAGKSVKVFADETRPWLQGLRLTAFELMEDRIPVQVIVDSAAGYFMRNGKIDLVITGADRIAANGDVANKIGTYQIAVLAKENGVPFYVAAPISTVDLDIGSGGQIPVEERDPREISIFRNHRIGPQGVKALNPAFDITPARYVTAIITEKAVVKPPYKSGLKKLQENPRKA